jgi:hypothetical protein
MSKLLEEKLKQIEYERYVYTTKSGVNVLFQRMIKDSMWYVVALNQIVNWGQYRTDLQEWCDMAL